KEAVAELTRKLTKVGFDCLCAAAIYPEMNWDLTVYLGETLFDERELLKEENMLPLVSLPYFRKGFMPEDLRKELMGELDGDSKRLVKGAILHLLQLNPLVGEEYSAEFFDYQLHIALQDAQLHPEDKHKLSTLQHLVEQKQFEESRYKQVVLRYLQMADKKLALGENFDGRFQKEDGRTLIAGDSSTSKPISNPSISKKKNAESNKKSSETYIYPKVNLVIRAIVAFFLFVIVAFLSFVSFIVLWFATESLIFSAFISTFIYLFFLTFDNRKFNSDNVRHNREFNALMVIDIHTNKRCAWWQSILRRGFMTFITVGFFLIIAFYRGLSVFLDEGGFRTEILAIPIGLWCINLLVLLLEVRGRKIGDYLAGTQVIYEADFQEGNFEIKK
ncbi:MAG: hypothetical protein ACPG49_14075, partial [Chitinophagales bacterium]